MKLSSYLALSGETQSCLWVLYANLSLFLLTPSQLVFQGEARVLDLQSTSGGSSVPPGHCPWREASLCHLLLNSRRFYQFLGPREYLVTSVRNTQTIPFHSLCSYGLRSLFFHVPSSWPPRSRSNDGIRHWRDFGVGGGETPLKDKEKGRGSKDSLEGPQAELKFSYPRKMWDLGFGRRNPSLERALRTPRSSWQWDPGTGLIH